MTVVMLLLGFVDPDVFLRLENTSLDGRFVVRGAWPACADIVLVAVDEQSLHEVGRWPWPRDTQARLVQAIRAGGAKVIGLDIMSFSEKHAAEAVVAQLNEYLQGMTDVIFRWNGTLDKLVGDSIVVFWNAPVEQPNHIELAVKCALNMRKRLDELQCKWRAEMEGLTRHFSTGIVLMEYTAVRLKALIADEERADNRGCLGHVALHKLGAVKVKDKESVGWCTA